MSDWQDISTAPKDGRAVLLFGGAPELDSDYSGEAFPSPMVAGWWEDDNQGGSWRYCSYDSGYYGDWKKPTHWQPLPAPPDSILTPPASQAR